MTYISQSYTPNCIMYFFSNVEIIFCQITSFHIISHQLIAVEVLPMLHGDEMTHT